MRYMGGKVSIAKDIVPFINDAIYKSNCKNYIEPFVGGANIMCNVKCENRYGGDANKYLIAMFEHIKNGGKLPESVSKEEYFDVREHLDDDKYPLWYMGAVGFLASYNGRWIKGGSYVGDKLDSNGRTYYESNRNTVIKQMEKMRDVNFVFCDYRQWDELIMKGGCVVYLDPPYDGTTNYRGAGTAIFDSLEMWEYARRWSKVAGNAVFISEEKAPYDFYTVWEKEVSRKIDPNTKKDVVEKLFVYGESIENEEVDLDEF